MDKPETLKIEVSELVKATAVGIGSQTSTGDILTVDKEKLVEDGKKVMNDEIARYYEHSMKHLQRYVPPHKVKSRWVKHSDVERIISEGQVMLELCGIGHGAYGNANAIAHSQIEDKEPLRFFVTNNGLLIINPVIISHTNYPVFKTEGCMSYPSEPMKTMIKRFNKITVRYQMLIKDESEKPIISKPQEITYNGTLAEVFQHEVHHLNGVYVYDDFYTPETCAWFGDGKELTVEELDKLYDEAQGQGEASKKDDDPSRIINEGAEPVQNQGVETT